MTEEEKLAHLSNIVDNAKKLLKEAQAFADLHGLTFRWDEDYGSYKQWYVGKGTPTYTDQGKWTSSSDQGC